MSHSHSEGPEGSVMTERLTGQQEKPIMCSFIKCWPVLGSADALLTQGACVCVHHSPLFGLSAAFVGTKLPQFYMMLLVDQNCEQILRVLKEIVIFLIEVMCPRMFL